MGAQGSKVKKLTKKTSIDILKLETIIKQILYQANLNKERKKGVLKIKENEFIELLKRSDQSNQGQIIIQAIPIVGEIRKVHAMELVVQYCDILLKNSSIIKNFKTNPEKVQELVPYIESVIYGCQSLGIEDGAKMSQMIEDFTDMDLQIDPSNTDLVLSEIQSCFNPKLPPERDVNRYIEETRVLCNPVPNKISQESTSKAPRKILGLLGDNIPVTESVDLKSSSRQDHFSMVSSSQLTGSFPHPENENNNNIMNSNAERYAQLTRSFSLPMPMEMSFGNSQQIVDGNFDRTKNTAYNKSKSTDFVSENIFPRMSQQERAIYPDFSTYSIDPSKFYQSNQLAQYGSSYQLSERLNKIRDCL